MKTKFVGLLIVLSTVGCAFDLSNLQSDSGSITEPTDAVIYRDSEVRTLDAGVDSETPTTLDSGMDAETLVSDSGVDSGYDSSVVSDSGYDSGFDADLAVDAGYDSGFDAGDLCAHCNERTSDGCGTLFGSPNVCLCGRNRACSGAESCLASLCLIGG